MLIIKLIEKLIEKKFYEKNEIQNKINVFYAMNVINEEEFANLTLKVEETYRVIEENIEEVQEDADNQFYKRIIEKLGQQVEIPETPTEEEYPLFVKPSGAHDAYKEGDKITYNNKKICMQNEQLCMESRRVS